MQHREVFDAEEYAIFQSSIVAMVADIDQAVFIANQPPDGPQLQVVHIVRSGRRGRPRIEVDGNFLEHSLGRRGPTRISKLLGCSSRTVRRRALESGLVDPQPPVFQYIEAPDGIIVRQHTTATVAVSVLTDREVIAHVTDCRRTFPLAGLTMIKGYFLDRGHNVQRRRISDALLAIEGVPGVFGGRQIERRVYRVPGPNSMWHHDGQHGKPTHSVYQIDNLHMMKDSLNMVGLSMHLLMAIPDSLLACKSTITTGPQQYFPFFDMPRIITEYLDSFAGITVLRTLE